MNSTDCAGPKDTYRYMGSGVNQSINSGMAIYANCLRGNAENGDKCTRCEPGYALVNNGCSFIQRAFYIPGCDVVGSTTACAVCDSGFYLNEGFCCKPGEFLMNFSGTKNCIGFDYFDVKDCDVYDMEYDEFNLPVDVMCEKCKSGFYESNGGCCAEGTGKFWDGDSCEDIAIVSIANCKQYNSNSECKQINDLVDPVERLDNCTAGYFINNHCCAENKYWDETQNDCVNINISNFVGTCAQINELGECIKCQGSLYLSDKNCCAVLSYFNGSTCALISTITLATTNYPGCKKISNKKCLECDGTTTPSHTLTDGCCTNGTTHKSYFNTSLKTCKAFPPNCTSIDLTTQTCTGCTAPKYTSPLGCCPKTQYYNITDNTCKAIPNQSTNGCQKIFDDDVGDLICGECEGATDVVRDGKCCEIDEVKVGTNCVKADLITDCVVLNDLGYCDKCKAGASLTGKIDVGGGKFGQVCCPFEDFYNETTFLCVDNTIGNCEIQLSTTKCSKCKNGFFLANNNENCCSIGKNYAGSACNTSVLVENCVKFTGTVCNECKENYNLYTDLTNIPNGICCVDGEYFSKETDLAKCVPIPKKTSDCQNYNLTTGNCEQCTSPKYLSDKICCPLSQKWDTTTKTCKTFTETNCNGYNTINTKCVSCTGSNYISDKKCCNEGMGVITSNGNCVDTSATPKFCKKTVDEICVECLDGYNFYGVNCCADGEYYDGACKASDDLRVEKCKVFDVSDLADLKCEVCQDGYFLLLDQKACCKSDDFVDGTDCYEEIDFFDGCDVYDQAKIQCVTCVSGYYNTNGICCEENKYLDLVDLTCKLINQVLYTNCAQFIINKNECIKCQENYKLKHSDKKCQLMIQNCSNYDAEVNICVECTTNYYLTNGICCSNGKYNKNGTCATIPINYTGCQKFEDNICKECADLYYLIDGFCCLKGHFKTGEYTCEEVTTLNNCDEFGSHTKNCTKCKNGFVLLKLNLQETYCLEITGKNCDQFDLIEENEMNKLKCLECTGDGVNFVKKATLSNTTKEFISLDKNVSYCENYHIKNVASESSLVCLKCNSIRFAYNDVCFTRQNNVNCESSLFLDKDHCSNCDPNFFLHQNGVCLENPKNCEIYDKSRDLCIKCESTHLLYYEQLNSRITSKCIILSSPEAAAPDFFPAFIKNCNITIPNCLPNIYKNLKGAQESLFSCHKCDNPKIPFTSYSGGKTTTNNQKNFNSLKTSSNPTTQSTLCLEPISSNFNNIPFEFPTNCALGLYNSDKPLNTLNNTSQNPDLQKMSLFCTACKPGYLPLYNDKFLLHVYNCVLIDFCDSFGKGVNRCDECDADYCFGVLDGKIDFGTCVANSDVNCYARDVGKGVCVFCKSGFVVNYDGKCGVYEAPFCDGSFKGLRFFDSEDLESGLEILPDGNGCVSCDAGYIGLYQNSDNFVCTNSQYVSDRVFVNNSTFYDLNCLKYGFDENLKKAVCKTCKTNYIIDINYKCITKIPIFKNCEIAKDNSNCAKCLTNFVIANNQCEEPSIKNCLTYSTNSENQIQTCSICEDKHYLKQNKCIEGTTQNCKEYNDSNICQKCDNTYSLVTIKDQKKLCYPITKHENCTNFATLSFQQNLIKCTKCSTNNFIIQNTQNKYVCNSFIKIENCQIYDKSDFIITSSFICLKCKENYYLKNNKCLERTTFVPNCALYDETSAACLYCKAKMYLNSLSTECLTNPEGISGCHRYLTPQKCSQCSQKLFLKDNKCFGVAEKNLVEHCGFYINDGECQECVGGTVLFKNRCETPIAQKCDRYLTSKECESCVDGYGIRIFDGERKCVEVEERVFCQVHEDFFPFACVVCENGFFLSQGECVKSSVVEDCEVYQGEGICGKCKESFVLSFDRKNCFGIGGGSECKDFRIVEPFCVLCEEGFLIDDHGDCVVDNRGKILGCLLMGENGECSICESGFYMNEKLICLTIDKGDIGDDGIIDDQEFRGIYMLYIWFLSFVFVYL